MSSSLLPSAKRPRVDAVIGLDIAGKLYYCRTSTLCTFGGSSSYFAARFGPNKMLDPEIDHVDVNGRNIYFIDRNPDLFEYILDYLRMDKLPSRLGNFQDNPDLWHALRDEADFFSLDGLCSLLKFRFACSPEEDGGKGILYWLGTNKGKEEYINPFKRQLVDVTGWFDEHIHQVEANMGGFRSWQGLFGTRELFVQYRPKGKDLVVTDFNHKEARSSYTLMRCNASLRREPVILDLKSYVVSPTHYSLRWGECNGLQGSWNLEASIDGENWVLLHTGRNEDDHKVSWNRAHSRDIHRELNGFFGMLENEREEEVVESHCDYMERNYRHIWELNDMSGQFFRYFRMIGADTVQGEMHHNDTHHCLHAIGFEIYGHVHEG